MKQYLTRTITYSARLLLVLLAALLLQKPALAVGTGAGLDISNTATVDYVIGGSPDSVTSNTATFRVDEKLDVDVTWQDAANVAVGSPDSNQVLSFLLTNTGNGNDSYTLAVQNTLGGDQFNPVFVAIYMDANSNGIFESGIDSLYDGSNDPSLNADESLAIFVLNNIPGSLSIGDLGNSELTATSNTLSGTPGDSLGNAGDNNTTAVVGTSGADDNAIGTYEVTNGNVSLVKSVVISDPVGGNQPMTGATLSYQIDVSFSGPGSANGVVITDAIPANTTYTSGSLRLNGTTLTDIADADAGDVDDTTPNTVTVDLGDLTPSPTVQTIQFDVTIN